MLICLIKLKTVHFLGIFYASWEHWPIFVKFSILNRSKPRKKCSSSRGQQATVNNKCYHFLIISASERVNIIKLHWKKRPCQYNLVGLKCQTSQFWPIFWIDCCSLGPELKMPTSAQGNSKRINKFRLLVSHINQFWPRQSPAFSARAELAGLVPSNFQPWIFSNLKKIKKKK